MGYFFARFLSINVSFHPFYPHRQESVQSEPHKPDCILCICSHVKNIVVAWMFLWAEHNIKLTPVWWDWGWPSHFLGLLILQWGVWNSIIWPTYWKSDLLKMKFLHFIGLTPNFTPTKDGPIVRLSIWHLNHICLILLSDQLLSEQNLGKFHLRGRVYFEWFGIQ